VPLATPRACRLEKLSVLPPDIVDRYQHWQFLLKLGLFPEISRVWCVVDTDFFMWHCEDYAADFQVRLVCLRYDRYHCLLADFESCSARCGLPQLLNNTIEFNLQASCGCG
jgi:hypothetical protein